MAKEWHKAVVSSTETLRSALKLLDATSLRIALAVDKDSTLVGVLTDGDIRRALLAGMTLDSNCIADAMNKSPVTALSDAPRAEVRELMKAKGLLAIPILQAGCVVDLATINDAPKIQNRPNVVFIMGGGFGKRLRPLTENCPKPMLKLAGKPILERIIERFIRTGFTKFIISTHYLPHVITDYFGDGSELGVDIRYVYEETPLGTGGALGLLPADLPDLPLVVVNGDVVTSLDFNKLLDFHDRTGGVATMCVRDYEYQVPYGVVTGHNNLISAMVEKPIQRFFINAGMYVLDSNVVRTVEENVYLDMPVLLEKFVDKGEKVAMFPVHEYWLDVGRQEDFNKADHYFMSHGEF